VVRLPLYHHAFMLMDLLTWGEVKLGKGADGSHVFIDTHDLVGYMGKFFAEYRVALIDEMHVKFP
jgi:hypothetical protein